MKENLFGKTFDELQTIVNGLSFPLYSANQLANWLYKKHAGSIEEMSNLSKNNREILNNHYTVRHITPVNVQVSADGTKKYLFKTLSGNYVEAAYIPEKERHTLCVSSQAGCKMGCLFCMTGKQGFQGNLCSAEILSQIVTIPERDQLTNIVYMGMGESLDNLEEVLKSLEILTSSDGFGMSPTRVTISTIGMIPAMITFIEKSKCHLAVSLHSPFANERKMLMPVESVFPISEVVKVLKNVEFNRQRRISFEYIMFKGLNDTTRHVNELSRLLNGLKCRVNLIRFHPIPDTPLFSSDEKSITEFRDKLTKKGITTTIRTSRGLDILAACGLLSTRQLVK